MNIQINTTDTVRESKKAIIMFFSVGENDHVVVFPEGMPKPECLSIIEKQWPNATSVQRVETLVYVGEPSVKSSTATEEVYVPEHYYQGVKVPSMMVDKVGVRLTKSYPILRAVACYKP